MKSNLYFKHDLYALDDTKLRRLVLKHGAIGYATFFETVAKLMKEETHRCELSFLVSDLAYALHEEESKISSALEYAIDCGLFVINGGLLESERVNRSCDEFSEYSHKQSEKAKKRWENKSNATASVGNATAMPRHNNSNATAMPIKEIEKENKDNKVSVVPTKYNPSTNKKTLINETDTLFAPSYSDESSEPTETKDNDPVFITISLISNKEYPIKESTVKMWEEAYPAVDVRGQLREMKAWCNSNPKERKTERGIMRFCNSWLSREQDKPSFRLHKGYNNKSFRPRDINGQYDNEELEELTEL